MEKLQSCGRGVVHVINHRSDVVLLVVEVALPARDVMRRSGAEDGAYEDALEGFLAGIDMFEQRGDHGCVLELPIVAQLDRHVQDVVEFAHHADGAVEVAHFLVIAQDAEDGLAECLFRTALLA